MFSNAEEQDHVTAVDDEQTRYGLAVGRSDRHGWLGLHDLRDVFEHLIDQSIDAIIDFFSETALPHDVTLVVGGATDFGVGALPSGVTAHLSRTQVHNGNGVIMTIAADANASAGDVHVVVRSKLDSSDFNDWPVILNVR